MLSTSLVYFGSDSNRSIHLPVSHIVECNIRLLPQDLMMRDAHPDTTHLMTNVTKLTRSRRVGKMPEEDVWLMVVI